jgi:TolB-like protein/Tfp pilus assembly protein PilF
MSRLKRLLVEAHQRSLWQALVIYLGASYAVLEAVQLFRDEFGLPDWLLPVALALLLIGLPVVIVASLAKQEVYGDEVPEEHAEAAAEEDRRLRLFTWRTAGLSFMAALAVWGVVAAGLLLFGGYGPVRTDERPSVAVLPLVNRSGLEEDMYFTDGIHDEILTQLSKISGLSVRGRTSVMEYRDSPKNLRQIGEELNARYLMEGGVQRAGATVRINVQLIDAENDEHVFVDTYDRELSVENLLAVQREVALRVADALEATLTAQEREQIEKVSTHNLEAYDYYFRARHEFYKYTPEGNALAIELLEKALVFEPEYALAHAGLSLCQSQMLMRSWSYDAEWLTKAVGSARAALEIDPDLAEGYFALGFTYEMRGMYEEMEEAMRAVLALNPNHAHAHDGLADVTLSQKGLLDDALREYGIARRLDPFLLPAASNEIRTLLYKGRYHEALRKVREMLETWPQHQEPRALMGDILRERGEHRAAIESYSTAIAADWGLFGVSSLVGRAVSYLSLGDTAACERETRRLAEMSNDSQRAKAEHNYVEGLIDLKQGRTREAISRFEEALSVPVLFDYMWSPRYGRALGEAYLADGQARAAAEVFDEMFRAYPFAKTLLYHKGNALEAAGDTAGAVAAYREFMEAWKDADEDAPLLVDAEARLVKLSRQGSERD